MTALHAQSISLNLTEDCIFFHKDSYYIVDAISNKRGLSEYHCLRIDNKTGDIVDSKVIYRLTVAEVSAAIHSGSSYVIKKDEFNTCETLDHSERELMQFQAWSEFFNRLEIRTGSRFRTSGKYVKEVIKEINWSQYGMGVPGYSTATSKITKVKKAEGNTFVLLPKKYRKNRGETTLPSYVYNEMMSYIMDNVMVFTASEKINVTKAYNNFIKYIDNLPKNQRQKFVKTPCRATFYNHVNQISEAIKEERRMSAFELTKRKRKQKTGFIINEVLERVEMDAVSISLGIVENVKNGKKEEQVYLGHIILMVAIDVYSRAILGYSYKISKNPGECSDLVVSCFQNTLLPKDHTNSNMYGRSFNLVVDQGTATNGNQLSLALADAETVPITTPVGQPWRKPFIERFFHTLRTDFLSEFDSYMGSKRYRNYGSINHDEKIEKLATLTEDEFINALDDYIANTYHVGAHAGLNGRSPLAVWNDAIAEYGQEIYTFPLDHKVFSRRGKFAEGRVISEQGTITLDGDKYFSDELKKLQLNGVKKVDVYYSDNDVYSITFCYEHRLYKAYLMPTNQMPEPYPGLQRSALKAAKAAYFGHIAKAEKLNYIPSQKSPKRKQRPKTGAAETRNKTVAVNVDYDDAKQMLDKSIDADLANQAVSTQSTSVQDADASEETTGSSSAISSKKHVIRGGKI